MQERSMRISKEIRKLHEEPVLKEYRPTFFSEGGDQLIFTFPDHSNVVAKVCKERVRQIVLSPDLYNIPFSDAPKDYRDLVSAELADERRRFSLLKQYFSDMVLKERFVITRIPLSEELVKAVFTNVALKEKIFIETPVRIQERKFLKRDDFISVTHKYVGTLGDTSLDQFLFSIKTLVSLEKPSRPYAEICGVLATIAEHFPRERILRETMGRFVQSAAKYTEETDEILDVVGTNNIVLDKDDRGKPRVTLIDAMNPRGGLVFSGVRKALEASRTRALCGRERNDVKNGIHYARFMTALAHEYAPECVARFQLPELQNQRAALNTYRALYGMSA